jgi:predicted phosphoribosyltransferase
MARAMFWHSGEVGEDELIEETGLSPEQIEQAVTWHNMEVERRRELRRRDDPDGEP